MPVEIQKTEPVALVCALMGPDETWLAQGRQRLAAALGPIRLQSPTYAFDYTTYYRREMGEGLVKQLVWFEGLVDPALLASVKQQTMELEKALGEASEIGIKRRVNLDPGLVSVESLVLVSTKYSGHRICIAQGLFGETTLLYQKGGYRPLEWTYPDYRSQVVQDFLMEVRAFLMQTRRQNA
jgi:hypothetical protein